MQQNRERVLAAAGRLIREQGFDSVSVAEVTKAAGLASPQLICRQIRRSSQPSDPSYGETAIRVKIGWSNNVAEKTVMLDHIGLAVSNLTRSRGFYLVALAPLSLGIVMEVTKEQTGKYAGTGFGANNKPFFWIGTADHLSGPVHVAFTASSRAEVDGFYKAALSVGGRDNGAPGVRAHYHPNYYGAFVLDPDGNNVEVVCHSPA